MRSKPSGSLYLSRMVRNPHVSKGNISDSLQFSLFFSIAVFWENCPLCVVLYLPRNLGWGFGQRELRYCSLLSLIYILRMVELSYPSCLTLFFNIYKDWQPPRGNIPDSKYSFSDKIPFLKTKERFTPDTFSFELCNVTPVLLILPLDSIRMTFSLRTPVFLFSYLRWLQIRILNSMPVLNPSLYVGFRPPSTILVLENGCIWIAYPRTPKKKGGWVHLCRNVGSVAHPFRSLRLGCCEFFIFTLIYKLFHPFFILIYWLIPASTKFLVFF